MTLRMTLHMTMGATNRARTHRGAVLMIRSGA